MNIKDYREKELKEFVIANVLAIIVLSGMSFVDGIVMNEGYLKLLCTIIEAGVVSGAIYALVMVFDSVISSDLKMHIVFQWRTQPGEKIFSKIREKNIDKRFTVEDIKGRYPKLYVEMPGDKKKRRLYENGLWYSMYIKNEDNIKIQIIQRDYLLCRDMTVSTLVTLILYILFVLFTEVIQIRWNVIIYLVTMFGICVIAANKKAERFVSTVIACDVKKDI